VLLLRPSLLQNYLRQEGGDHWKGSLYVFDARMAIAPEDASCDTAGCTLEDRPPLPAAVPCQVGGRACAKVAAFFELHEP
jgi:predicted sulfurtransferase